MIKHCLLLNSSTAVGVAPQTRGIGACLSSTDLVQSIERALEGVLVATVKTGCEGPQKLWPILQAADAHNHSHAGANRLSKRLAGVVDRMQQRNLRSRQKRCPPEVALCAWSLVQSSIAYLDVSTKIV